MSVYTDFYAATEEEAEAAFSWLQVGPIGEEPHLGGADDLDRWEAWSNAQAAPEQPEHAAAVMSELPSLLDWKFILEDKISLLRELLAGNGSWDWAKKIYHAPGAFSDLKRLPEDLTAALATLSPERIEEQLRPNVNIDEHRWSAEDAITFTLQLAGLARIAVRNGRRIYVLTTGPG